MNYQELTPTSQGRYDGYMDPNIPEQSPITEGEFLSDAEVRKMEARKWKKRLDAGSVETDVAPAGAETSAEGDIVPRAQSEARKITRDKLMEISKTIQSRSSPSEVVANADFVAAAVKILEHNVRADVKNYGVNKEILKEMDEPDGGIFKKMQDIMNFLKKQRPDGQTTDREDTEARQATVFGEARAIAKISEQIAAFYEKAEISKEYDDPFKQIVSFEELMTKFNITLDDDRFRPGGEFSLLDITAYVDNFGREMSTETAHPENFLRWVEERAWFYHDFDPMKDINLFEGMYIVAGARKVSMYEMLVDFNAYFAHRKPTKGELQVKAEDINRAEEQGKFKELPESLNEVDPQTKALRRKKAPPGHEDDPEYDPRVIGYYTTFVDPETGESVKAYVRQTGARKERTGEDLYDVFYEREEKDGEKIKKIREPVREWLANKEKWEVENKTTSTSKEFQRSQEEIMYQLWLMTSNHNYDVSYRQKGMPNEKPLNETMAEIYSDNKFTRTRRRLWAVLDIPATTHRDEIIEKEKGPDGKPKLDRDGKPIYHAVVAPSEAQKKFKSENGKLGKQGSLGKAIQRSLAGYYHISEANAAFGGYSIDQGINPFFEVLKNNREGINGAEIVYSSVIRRLLLEDPKFGYIYDGYEKGEVPLQSKIDVEFFNALNDTEIPRTQEEMKGTFRKRHDWEKADFVDFMTLNRQDFLKRMAGRQITTQSLDKTFEELEKRYSTKDPEGKNEKRLKEIRTLKANLDENSDTRREAFIYSLIGKSGIKPDDILRKDEVFSEKDADGKPIKDKDGKYKIRQAREGEVKEKDGFLSRFLTPDSTKDKGDPMKGLDLLAVGLFTKAFGSEFTPDMNPFSHIRYSLEARELMRGGMRDALSYTEQLDEFEAKWAEEWAYTFTFYTGISARNDMLGIGHDAWSKILNTEWYRLRQTGGGNYPGNLENLYGIHRLGVNFWEGLVVREDDSSKFDKNLYEELVGLEVERNKKGEVVSARFNVDKDMKGFEFAGNAQRQFYADHINHTIELFIDITQKHEFNFDKIVGQDSLGRVVIHHAEMQKLIDSTWKHMRYGFDNNNFLYDNPVYAWHYDEAINADGKVSRTPKFALMKMRDSMFAQEVMDMDMYRRKDVSSWIGYDKNGKETDVYHTKMGRNVFAYLIKAQLEEHVKHKERAKLYSADQISLITDAFINYAASVMKGEHGEAITLSGFFTPEEIRRILVSAHAVLWMLYAKEYGQDALGGFIAAMIAGMQILTKEIGSGITLKAA